MSKKKTVRSKKAPAKAGVTSFSYIPKRYGKDKLLHSTQVENFLKHNLEGTRKQYQTKMVKYLSVYLKTEPTVKQAIDKAQREIEYKMDNRISFVKKERRSGKKVWRDNKTGEIIKGKKVRQIVWRSTRTKVIEILAEQKDISYDRAKRIYEERIDKKYIELKKQKRTKDKVNEWKKEGLTKAEVVERMEAMLEGRAELRTIRNITDSYYYG